MGGFKYNSTDGVGFYTIPELDSTGIVKTCFSTRIGGVSPSGYSSLNLGYKTSDEKSNVDKNINILCSAAGFKIEDLVLSDQVHGDRCRVAASDDRGKGILVESDIKEVDALVTSSRDVALCIFTADCIPVFLLDVRNKVIALCHAGWRGVINNIVPKTIKVMSSQYNTNNEDIIAAVAPSIGPCCFDVGTDVAGQFMDVFEGNEDIIIDKGGHLKINLWEAIKVQLEASGLKMPVIMSGLCTCCIPDEFYSYRRDGSVTGRMISIMQLE